jgi:lysophospholipase L1-like esterase
MTGHVLLLGDSVLDNGAYVGDAPDVARQLRQALPRGWHVTLLAVDGATTAGVARQLSGIPDDATHLVISAGGNDALAVSGLLQAPSRSVSETLSQLADVRQSVESAYSRMLQAVSALGVPYALCTIYDPRFSDPTYNRAATTALMLFNDVILREAFRASAAVIDLRLICSEDTDFANSIEPSVKGGAKIAGIVSRLVTRSSVHQRSQIYAG